MTDAPADSALQSERTLLAWRRTCLSLAVGSAAGLRFAAPVVGQWIIPVGVVSIALAGGAYVAAMFRYRRIHEALVASGRHREGALPMSLIAVSAVTLAVLAIVFVASSAVRS